MVVLFSGGTTHEERPCVHFDVQYIQTGDMETHSIWRTEVCLLSKIIQRKCITKHARSQEIILFGIVRFHLAERFE